MTKFLILFLIPLLYCNSCSNVAEAKYVTIDSTAVWQLPPEANSEIWHECKADSFKQCAIKIAKKYGANDKVLNFMKLTDGSLFIDSFYECGNVDLVSYTAPFRANTNWGYIIVNCENDIFQLDSFELINSIDIKSDSLYNKLTDKYNEIEIFAAGMSFWKHEYIDNKQRFFFEYNLISEIRINVIGKAVIYFDFNSDGKFENAQLYEITDFQ